MIAATDLIRGAGIGGVVAFMLASQYLCHRLNRRR
jgi:hypothetical protein